MEKQLTAPDVDYVSKVRDSFANQGLMQTLNASVQSVYPGKVELELPYQTDFTQQHGFLHGGVVSTMLDTACGYAAYSLMPKGAEVLTIELKTNFLSPAKGEVFKAVGRVRKSGRTISVTEGDLFAISEGEPKLVATMVATMMAVYPNT